MLPASTLIAAPPDVARFFRLVADETRLMILRLLALSDLRAGEIGEAMRLPPNAVSYHLKRLRTLGLLRDRHSSADARDVYYHLDVGRLQSLYSAAGDTLYSGMSPQLGVRTESGKALSRPLRVLFLCTHNSARSQIAEALLRHMGGDQVAVFSAGSMPTEVHPQALVTLRELEIDTRSLYAKSMDMFIGEPFDYIITVCDRVRDICPAFLSDPAQIHWSMPDPVVVEDAERCARAFRDVAMELQTRIRYLLMLPHPGTGERFKLA
jgi:protein-tyrosine-phosphatase/DNA-binding HxlR family transcriptional regulator